MRLVIDAEERTAVLHSKPTPKLLALLPALEGRRLWLKAGGVRIDASGWNVSLLSENFPELIIQRLSGDRGSTPAISGEERSYRPKTAAYAHQKLALERAREAGFFFALFMEQGTGKTKVAIDYAGELWAAGKIDAAIVVAKKGVHRQWIESQLPEHFGGEWSGIYWDAPNIVGRIAKGMQWLAVNYDALRSEVGREVVHDFARRRKGRLIIIADETQEIKNPSSRRHKEMEALKRVSLAPYRLALTGTPIAKDLTDEWAQLRWLDESILGIRYASAFRAEFCIMGGFEGREVIAHKNIDRFKRLTSKASFRATKEELGLMPKVYRSWRFALSGEQARFIRSIRETLVAQIDSGEVTTARSAAVALLRIQQASNGFCSLDDGKEFLFSSNPRIEALKEVLDAYPGKTVIWAKFRRDFALIKEALLSAGESFTEYHGSTPARQRPAAVESFLQPDGPRIFLSSAQVGGTGLNLQGHCRHAIYYANSFNAIDRWQSEDRLHRIGTSGSVVYTDLIARGSVDAAILLNLKKKRGLAELVLDDIRRLLDDETE